MPVALASAMRCRTGSLRATTCTHRLACSVFRLTRTRQIVGRSARAKAILRALGRCRACPSRGASGTRVTGSIRRGGWRTSVTRRAGRDLPRTPPREGRRRRRDRGAFCRAGTLTRAEDCSSVRAWTAAPSRRLRRGIARGHARLFNRFRSAFF